MTSTSLKYWTGLDYWPWYLRVWTPVTVSLSFSAIARVHTRLASFATFIIYSTSRAVTRVSHRHTQAKVDSLAQRGNLHQLQIKAVTTERKPRR